MSTDGGARFVRIVTPRLLLREYTPDDWEATFAYQRDPRYLRYYPWTGRTPQDAKEFVRTFVGWQAETPRRRAQLAVALRCAGELIGSCGVRRKPDDDSEAEIGYEVAPAHWGQGYATEAASAMAAYAFREWRLRRLSSWCIAENAASARVLEKLGMLMEGRLPANKRFKGRAWDVLLFGMTREQWLGRQRAGGEQSLPLP